MIGALLAIGNLGCGVWFAYIGKPWVSSFNFFAAGFCSASALYGYIEGY